LATDIVALNDIDNRLSKLAKEASLQDDYQEKENHNNNNDPCWSIANAPSAVFYPKRFMEQGKGQPFLQQYQFVTTGQNGTQWEAAGPKCHLIQYSIRSRNCQPIYYHIHKNGGTSMNNLPDEVMTPENMQPYYSKQAHHMGDDKFQRAVKTIMQTAYQDPHQYPVFTFLRCPYKRFLSGLYQSMPSWNNICDSRDETNKDLTRLITCVLKTMRKEGVFVNLHLVPQAYELYYGMFGKDIPVHVLDMKYLTTPLGTPGRARERSKERRGYDFSNTQSLPSSLIRDICDMYQVDVRLVQETKVTTTICSQYIL
jgi:hypothetical protein